MTDLERTEELFKSMGVGYYKTNEINGTHIRIDNDCAKVYGNFMFYCVYEFSTTDQLIDICLWE